MLKKNKAKSKSEEIIKDFKVDKILSIFDTNLIRGAGHNGLILLDKNNRGIYYGAAKVRRIIKTIYGEDVHLIFSRIILSKKEVKDFLLTGKLPLSAENSTYLQKAYYVVNNALHYNDYIEIPIKKEENKDKILKKAEEVYHGNGKYNMYKKNCAHYIQEILHSIDEDYAPIVSEKPKDLEKDISKALSFFFSLQYKKMNKTIKKIVKETSKSEITPTSQFYKGVKLANDKKYEIGHIQKWKSNDWKYFHRVLFSVNRYIGDKRFEKCKTFLENHKDSMNKYQLSICEDFINKQLEYKIEMMTKRDMEAYKKIQKVIKTDIRHI